MWSGGAGVTKEHRVQIGGFSEKTEETTSRLERKGVPWKGENLPKGKKGWGKT